MKRSLLLFLSANRLHAQIMSGGKIVSQRDFTDNQRERDNFTDFLKTNKYPTYLLTDLIEEDFRHEIVPHLIGNSHKALLKRKFDQFYRGTPFHQATLLQRQKSGRRDDDMLFSALTNPTLIMPWLNILLVQEIPLAGIYSVPQISAPLVKNHPSKHLLLISWEKFSGLRQTYFSDHRLQISRLTPVHEDQTFNEAVLKELARTYQYLKSLSLLPAGQTLDVRILCHADDRDELKNQLFGNEDMHYDFADIEEVGRQLKIDYRFTDSDASQIFLHQLAASRPKTHYANAEHTHYYSLRTFNIALKWSAILLFIASLLLSIVPVWQGSGNEAGIESLKLQAQRTLKEADMIRQTLPASTVAPTDMKAGVNIIRKLELYRLSPQDLLSPVSLVLDHFPQARLDEINLQTSVTEPVASNTQSDVPAHVITLKGNLTGFAGNYRSALKYLDRLQLELSKHTYQVEILAKPLDVSPSGSLADQRGDQENIFGFSLKLVWRPSI